MIRIKHKLVLYVGMAMLVFIVAGMGGYSYYRATHFNENVRINGVVVGGLNARATLTKLKAKKVDNNVYVAGKVFLKGKETSSGFTQKDLKNIQSLMKKQWTFFPKKKIYTYQITPSKVSDYREKVIEPKLKRMLEVKNVSLVPAVDTHAVLKYGEISYTAPQKGKQYNISKMISQYLKQKNKSETRIKRVIVKPLTSLSSTVQKQRAKLEELSKRIVVYKVQQTDYRLTGTQVISQATYLNGNYQIAQAGILSVVNAINSKQATLQKGITFKTHAGNTVSVPGGTYGWALKGSDSYETISSAFIEGKKEINAASDIYGVGYLTYGTGYNDIANDGIGTTYAEVSIEDQRAWFYIDGKEVYTTNIVTGKHSTNEDTPKGVWYVMYKQSPATLQGSEVGNANYSVKVNYWAQFTSSGCGFHDASWRTDWSSTAYLTNGSGGCANTPSQNMKSVYDSLSQKEAVVVY